MPDRLVEADVLDDLSAHRRRDPQLHGPFALHLEVEPRCVFARLLSGPGFHRLEVVRHRHGRHAGADAELRARQRLAATAQADDAVIDEVFSAVVAFEVGFSTLRENRCTDEKKNKKHESHSLDFIQCTTRSSSSPRGLNTKSTATRPPNTIMR